MHAGGVSEQTVCGFFVDVNGSSIASSERTPDKSHDAWVAVCIFSIALYLKRDFFLGKRHTDNKCSLAWPSPATGN